MNLENYRSSLDYREILRILQKASNHQENFLWQSHALGKNIISIHHFEIDFVGREVVVYLDTDRNKIDMELPIYIKLDYRTSVFKVVHFRVGQSSIHFSFPKEIKTQELRTYPRKSFLANVEKVISLKPSTGGTDKGPEIQVRALDISQFGLGLLVSEYNRSFLKNNRILWITKLGDKVLEYPVLGEVVYMNNDVDSKLSTRKQKEIKVGLKLSGVFPLDTYQQFIQ